ncbi:MAG TPA: hypothetical protein VHB45_15550 [Alloacidobacterium sp.]|nr:hypothetical protein [Alloacidobacterium sp.]
MAFPFPFSRFFTTLIVLAGISAHALHAQKANRAGQSVQYTNVSPAVEPAVITLKNGSLLVNAHNSDLAAILQEVSRLGGMTIDGAPLNTPVFGTYGPGEPHDVLTSLLLGTGYNFIMVGKTSVGMPRELLLSAKNSTVSAIAASVPTASLNQHPESSQDNIDEEPPGPGAITHVPPSGSEDPQERVQQNLQRLTHMWHQQNESVDAPQ